MLGNGTKGNTVVVTPQRPPLLYGTRSLQEYSPRPSAVLVADTNRSPASTSCQRRIAVLTRQSPPCRVLHGHLLTPRRVSPNL